MTITCIIKGSVTDKVVIDLPLSNGNEVKNYLEKKLGLPVLSIKNFKESVIDYNVPIFNHAIGRGVENIILNIEC